MRMKLDTPLCRMLGIRYPIIAAGMAGGPSTPELAAAVSKAGGLGTLGAAYLLPDAIREAVRRVRSLTDRPFAVNLFAASPMSQDGTQPEEVQAQLNLFRDDLGIPRVSGAPAAASDRFAEQVQVLLEEKVPVISTAFGILPEPCMTEAKAAGAKVIAMATTVREAIMAEQAGCHAIVAQGTEAGGHRGTFDVALHPMGANVGTFALVPQIVDRVSVPVVAAGGIMDGRGLVAALALGAQGVQMGTRFLTAAEAGTHAAYRKALLESTEESTVLTKAFSGRPARGIANAFIRQWDEAGLQPLAFPMQNTATRDIRNAAAVRGDADYMSLWAGQGTRLLKPDQGAADIVEETVRRAETLLSTDD